MNRANISLSKILISVGVLLVSVGCAPNPAERNNTGNNLTVQGNYAGAVQAYQVAEVLQPDSPIPYYNAGVALARNENLEAAALTLEQALKTADDELIKQAYYNLGIVYYADDRYFDAVDAFKQVLLRDPDDAEARYNYELALLNAVPPTPENQQQQNQPETDNTDPDVTPTPQPNALTGPTLTPPVQDQPPDLSATLEGGTGDFGDDNPSTMVPQENGSMTMEDAQRLLDSIEEDQQSLSEYLNEGVPAGDPSGNDW
jgi:tetratricopeptide (TPR) repeat protein